MRQILDLSPKTAGLIVLVTTASLASDRASAGFFDFLFGPPPPQHAAPMPAEPFGANAPSSLQAQRADAGRSSGYCVRSCDGRYFPVLAHGGASPAQMCQAFCPATATKVYFGGTIDTAATASGERYADSENAFAYRRALKSDCTCNGRDPTGLAPIDLSLDTTLRPGDVIATSSGLVAYAGSRIGDDQSSEFTPVANYPGLTADVRAKLGEMRVMPVSADLTDDGTAASATDTAPSMAASRTRGPRAARAALD